MHVFLSEYFFLRSQLLFNEWDNKLIFFFVKDIKKIISQHLPHPKIKLQILLP